MTTWRHAVLGVAMCIAPAAAFSQACTTTLSPGANITAAMETAANGATICLNPGDYTAANTGAYVSSPASFAIARNVKILGLGATPADTRLNGGAGGDYALKFMRYTLPSPVVLGNPSGASIENVTIQGSNGGIIITDGATRLTDIKIKDVVVRTAVAGTTWGVFAFHTDRIVVDNANIESYQAGISLIDTFDSLVMNSTVVRTWAANAVGLQVFGGANNVIVGNTIGSAKVNPADNTDASYPIQSGNTVFYNTQSNRFEGNLLQGHRDDGLDFQALDLTGTLPAPQATQQSTDNYAAKNTVISTGYAAGRVAGSGIWVNCASNNTWLYANDSQGSAECGTCVWLSRNTMLLGNWLHNNRLAGIVVSGGAETPPFCSNVAYRQKPQSIFLRNNYGYFNGNEQVVIRASDTTDMSLNYFSSTNGFGGAAQTCATAGCQAAFAIEGDPADAAKTSNGVRVRANAHTNNARGIQSDDGKVTGLEFSMNRMLNASSSNRFVSGPINIDAGTVLGGNFWAQHTAFGNPSTSNPYSGVFHDLANNTGNVVDRFPYQTEDFGRGWNVAVYEPKAQHAARGTKRTVRWYAPGCTYVDISLDGATTLATSVPNIGYHVVTIPDAASIATHSIVVKCKDSSGNLKGTQGTSPTFNVTSATLKLMAPGRDDVFNSNSQIWVGWKKDPSIATVDVDFSNNGGVSFTTLATGVTGTSTRVTLPNITSTAIALIRVRSGSAIDTTDGYFAVRGTTGAGITNIAGGRVFIMGQAERIEWASPQNSRLATITATRGVVTKTLATDLPDRGYFDWVVDEMGSSGALTVSVSFKQSNGTAISSVNNASGTVLYPTTITFGATPSIAPGGTGSVSATLNRTGTAAFTSQTPSVCTVSGTTVSGVVTGVCTITASISATATHAAAQSTLTFTIGQAQTITFGAAPVVVVNGTGTVSATASSGLAVTFSTLTPSVCTISGTTVSGLVAGTCTIAANQAGNGTFSPAPQVTQNITVAVGTDIPRLANISTRGPVLTGNDVMIGGFIIGGSAPKKVLVTARGPSLAAFGVPGVLPDPTLQLYSGQTVIAANDNWQTNANAAEITATGVAPTNALESALLVTLSPGAYTAIVSGVSNTTGVGIVEVFEADHPEIQLINISTRGQVQTVNNVMIGGFIIQGNAARTVLITARGPSLIPFGIANALSNPKLEIYAGQTKIHENDNFGTASNLADIIATGVAPTDPNESAILVTLSPGAYTAIVSGVSGVTGVGIVEVFAR